MTQSSQAGEWLCGTLPTADLDSLSLVQAIETLLLHWQNTHSCGQQTAETLRFRGLLCLFELAMRVT
ncbi:hypothetical protein NECAME_02450 [Necator americanus]|uniref:Uncharacterized protein n=1 Tax=Necator americanus TaxID=51031 RepID=W2TET5_NECAM|nr:hypothetical protein NECAME_02450 [Necator americanus]ETN80318.1 hypothetical protein NECAME_02450 [Necator americanus]